MDELYYRWQRHRESEYPRYYELRIRCDLFGQWTITRAWGRSGARVGRVAHTVNEAPLIESEVQRTRLRRERHGYELSTLKSVAPSQKSENTAAHQR